MAIYKNGSKIDKIYRNGKTTSKIYKNGSPIYNVLRYKIMTVKIDQNNLDHEACCTYADDAVDMVPGSAEWDEFFGHYPVMFKNGVEGQKLDRNDFSKHEDGTPADITSGDEGDVMIAFPRRGLRISTDENDIVTVSMTDNPNDPTFEYNAHRRGEAQKDIFYLGAYGGFVLDNKLRSLSGKKIYYPGHYMYECRNYAQANGKSDGTSSGYEIGAWFQLVFRQAMYLLKFKNTDSQTAVGRGQFLGDASNTGGTDKYGMDSEIIKKTNPSYMTDNKHQVKCLGIEDFWGNFYEWIDGIYFDFVDNENLGFYLFTTTTNFDRNRAAYENSGRLCRYAIDHFITKISGTTKGAFLPTTTGYDLEKSCFPDGAYVGGNGGTDVNDVVYHGNSDWNAYNYGGRQGDGMGVFNTNFTADSDNNENTARLMYL